MSKSSGRLLFLPVLMAMATGSALAEPWAGEAYDDPRYLPAAPADAGPKPYSPPARSALPAQPMPPPLASRPPVAKPAVKAAEAPQNLPPGFAEAANQPVLPSSFPSAGGKKSDPAVVRLQVLLDRANVSPGVIDGLTGGNLAKAVGALQNMYGLPSTGRLGPQIDELLAPFGQTPVLVPYTITAEDAAGPYVGTIPKDYAELAKLPALGYRNIVEALAERFHMDEGFLRRLNPNANFNAAGTVITVADVGPAAKTKVAHLVADAAARQLLGYDAEWNVVVAYPATIGSTDMPSPSGIHAVKAIAVNPVYWYRPAVNFQQGKNTKALQLAPGPNNPVGAVWIGLDKPTYGIHGTPEPSRIDKTNSHGCLRLTNWDAKELARLVRPGVDVEFVDPTQTASIAPPAQ